MNNIIPLAGFNFFWTVLANTREEPMQVILISLPPTRVSNGLS